MSIKIVYRPVSKNETYGFLKIRIIENRKQTIKSLGIKIYGKNWLADKQRVSKAEPNADAINEKITEVLRDLTRHDAPAQAVKTSSKTILSFYDEIISTTLNNGTRLKYIGIRNRFEKYLLTCGLKDLKFIQLTPQHVAAFHTFIRNEGSAINTANYNLKSFKAVINKAIKSGLVNFTHDPFALLKFKYTQTKNKTLTKDEVERLISKNDFVDHRKKRYNNLNVSLEEFRDIFLFQLFTQGLRCSDVQLLRWSDFSSVDGVIILDYTQYKTKKIMRLKLTLIALKMLNRRLYKVDENFESKLWVLDEKRERYKNLEITTQSIKQEFSSEREKQKVKDAWDKANGVDTNLDFKEYTKLYWKQAQNLAITHAKEQIKDVEQQIYKLYYDSIFSIKNRESFVFHFLQNSNFESYKSGANLTELQYKRLTGTRHYYNIILKQIAMQCGITTVVTSHVARHTYTQLLLNNRADVVAVSQSLGHSHISTTQTYIQQLPNNSLLEINEVLSKEFS